MPWSWPWALGVIAGAGWIEAATARADTSSAAVAAAVAAVPGSAVAGVVGAGTVLLLASGWARGATAGGRRAALLVLWLGLGATLVGLRSAVAAGVPDPWVGRLGDDVVLDARVVDGVAWPPAPARRGVLLRGDVVADGRFLLEGRLEPLPGRRNPGGFDLRAHQRRRGVTAALVVTAAEPLAAPGALDRTRTALRAGVTAGLDGAPAALMQALTLGVRDDLGAVRERFATSGLAHVLALSGLHVGVLAAALVALVGGVDRVRAVTVVAVLLAYVAVVGVAPSLVRATAMVAAALLGRAFGIGGVGWGSHLALAAAGSVLARPAWVGDLGFQLSYLSVLGMGWGAAPLARGIEGFAARWRRTRRGAQPTRPSWRRAGRWVANASAVSVAAQAATLPLVASTFGAVPLAAPLANLVAVPLATLLVPLGFAAALAGLIDLRLAALVNHGTDAVARLLLGLAGVAARGPVLPWGEVAWVGHVAYAIGAGALLAGLHRAWRPWRSATVIAAAMGVTLAVPPVQGPPDLFVLDVGQGDATVVRVARGQAVLVDGGGTPFGDFDVGARTVVPALRALGVGALPLVVATHPDLDHIEGLSAVLRTFRVGALLVGHDAPDVAAYRDLVALAEVRGVPVIRVHRGDRFRVGDLAVDVLHPEARSRGAPNDDSVAVLLRWREAPWALLLGDVPAAVEATLPVPPTPVLLAPHHGSSSSTSEALLRAARPRWALVSVGTNRYGHPSPTVLARLAASGAGVRITRDEGALRVPFPPP